MPTNYFPQPGDKVRIVALHDADAHSHSNDNFIGRVYTIDERGAEETLPGAYSFISTEDPYKSPLQDFHNYTAFYAAYIEKVCGH
jgi:hypothetical protein